MYMFAHQKLPITMVYIPPGRGAITANEVALADSAFGDDPPTFTLHGDTSGGPPETYIWRRNGQEISDGGAYSISIRVNDVFSDAPTSTTALVNRESHYRSTLVVTGDLPGVYEYFVTNRATNTMVVKSFNIEGKQKATHCDKCLNPQHARLRNTQHKL